LRRLRLTLIRLARTVYLVDSEGAGFTEKETAAIIRRALELQHRAGAGGASQGFRIEEIQRIGQEAGISPELVRRAAEELAERRHNSPGSFWLGAATVQTARSDLSGSARALEDLIPAIEEAAERDGKGALTKNALQWRSRLGLTLVRVKKEGEGRISIRADVRTGAAAAGLFPGIMGGLGLGAGFGVGFGVGLPVLHSPLFIALFPIGMFAASWLLARTIYRHLARSAAKRARGIVEAVRRVLLGG
jgi:hypothetical protein